MSKFAAAGASVSEKKPKRREKSLFSIAVMTLYHLRKVVMAIPVVFAALWIAAYNEMHLPSEVGLFLQNNGDFLRMVDRGTAVMLPFLLTVGCLVLMFFSKKAMYTWAISIFTLALPLLILVSNIYPA